MKIGVIAATGKAGRLISKEAYDRRMDVTAIVRNKDRPDTDSYAVMERDIMEITADDVRNSDAAGAIVDEIEKKKFAGGKRFTAVSERS